MGEYRTQPYLKPGAGLAFSCPSIQEENVGDDRALTISLAWNLTYIEPSGTNDTNAIQAAFDAGGYPFLDPGETYYVLTTIDVPSNRGLVGNGATIVMLTAAGSFDNADATLAARTGTNAVLFRIQGTSDSVRVENAFIKDVKIQPDAFVDDTWLVAIYMNLTKGVTISNVEVTGFSRGTGIKADNNNSARFLDCHIHDFFTATDTANSQMYGFEIDGDAAQLTDVYGFTYASDTLLFRGNTIAWLACSETTRAALGWQADAFNLKGANGRGAGVYVNKPTRNVLIIGNTAYMVAEAVDCFGVGVTIQSNTFQRVLVGVKLIYGATDCIVAHNAIFDAAYYSIEINGTIGNNYKDADGNIIAANKIKRVRISSDWYGKRDGSVVMYDYSAAGDLPYGNGITPAGIRFTIPASCTNPPTNTLVDANDIDLGYDAALEGLSTIGIFHEATAGGSATQRATNNVIRNYGSAAITDTADCIMVTVPRGSPSRTITATSGTTVGDYDETLIFNTAGSATFILPYARVGRRLTVKTITANTVAASSAVVKPLIGGAAGSAILSATAGKWAILEGNGTDWDVVAAN